MTYFDDAPATGHPIAKLTHRVGALLRARRMRRRLRNVLDLDDHMLDDIGVTRAEVIMAANLPLSVNAAVELHRMALERRRQNM